MTQVGETVSVSLPPEDEGEPEKSLKVRIYAPANARCGDRIRLVARSQNIDSDTPVELKVKQKGKSKFTYNGTLIAGAEDADWISKVQTGKTPEPPFDLEGKADGLSAKSDNQLKILKYADIASQTKTIPCSSPPYGWTGKFDIELKSGVLLITTKVKLVNRDGTKPAQGDPMPAVKGKVSLVKKLLMRADIRGKLTDKHLFHRKKCKRGNGCDCKKKRSCCKIRVKVDIKFVESGAHHTVNLFKGAGRANARNWTRVKTRANSYAHETGHLLGWYDEYAGGAVGSAPRWKIQATGVMSSGLVVPKEYYWDFRDWLKLRTGEDWEIVPP